MTDDKKIFLVDDFVIKIFDKDFVGGCQEHILGSLTSQEFEHLLGFVKQYGKGHGVKNCPYCKAILKKLEDLK